MEVVGGGGIVLLQLDNVADRLWDERRLESFFESGTFRFVEFSDLAGGSDDKREGPFKKEDDGGHVCKDISS